MRPQTVRVLRRHAVVYLGLAATGAVIGWSRKPRTSAVVPGA